MNPKVFGILFLLLFVFKGSLGQEIVMPSDSCSEIALPQSSGPEESLSAPESKNLSDCEILKNCVNFLSVRMQTTFQVVKIEQMKDTESKLYALVCGHNDPSLKDLGIKSDDQFYRVRKGIFKISWDIKYNFLLQIKRNAYQSFELTILPTVYEKRSKCTEWKLCSDVNKDTNLPETIYTAYENLSHNVYQYLAQFNTH